MEAVTANRAVIEDEALAVWADFLRFHATVTDQLERELTARAGMPLTWFDVLLHLDAASAGRLRMQELAAAVVLSRSGLTRVVDRLEAAGFVKRTSCPSDRRGTNAEITEDGRAAFARRPPRAPRGRRRTFRGAAEHDRPARPGRRAAALARSQRRRPVAGRWVRRVTG